MQLGVLAASRVLVRVVVGTILMTPSVLLVRRFEREVSIPVDADDHAPVQAEATAGQDGEADEKAGSNMKPHKIQGDDSKARELTGQKADRCIDVGKFGYRLSVRFRQDS